MWPLTPVATAAAALYKEACSTANTDPPTFYPNYHIHNRHCILQISCRQTTPPAPTRTSRGSTSSRTPLYATPLPVILVCLLTISICAEDKRSERPATWFPARSSGKRPERCGASHSGCLYSQSGHPEQPRAASGALWNLSPSEYH